MAYEILNNGPATPHRVHALVRLVARLQPVKRQVLLDLVQPRVLVEKQETGEVVLKAAIESGLLVETDQRMVSLTSAAQPLDDVDRFRSYMQHVLTGVTAASSNNYLLNQFTAWYAVQNDRVFQLAQSEYPVRFNSELYPGVEPRPFNDTKLSGWRSWATFVGWGWLLPQGTRELLVPDARSRLKHVLDRLLPEHTQALPFNIFAERLAGACPELDGGTLFEQAWQASRGAQGRGSSLSLMLSTALRALHDEQTIVLIFRPDAAHTWTLFPAEGHIGQQVTHIQRGRSNAAAAL